MRMNSDQQLDEFFGIPTETTGGKESLRDSLTKRLSIKSRLRLLPKVLTPRERHITFALLLIIVGSFIALPITAYFHYTTPVPARGGTLVEGVLGEPRHVNPLLLQTSDADRDIATLVFAGLMRYSGQGQIVPDLAKSHPEVTSDGLTYTVQLREDATWHDGTPVTADDVIFTVQAAQNQDYDSPLQVNWAGVEVQKVTERVVSFTLKSRYPQFLNNLTMGILPQHLWGDVRPINFPLSELNLKPVGAGPFAFASLTKNKQGQILSYTLEAHDDYHGGRPYLDSITLKFYESEDELVQAFNDNDIESIGYVSSDTDEQLQFGRKLILERLKLPRYFALFLNQNQSEVLSDKNVRLALAHATNRVAIINDVLDGNAFLVDSPLLGGILDINPNVPSYDFDVELARSILESGGYEPDEDGIMARRGNRLELTIVTSTWHELARSAELIAEQWRAIGVQVNIETLPVNQLNRDVISPRAYQVLLFGQVLMFDPDPYTLWHSSQVKPPGGNLSLYANTTADKLMDEARQTTNPIERSAIYDEFQKVLIDDIPAIFLYSPYYLYGRPRDLRGFNTELIALPSERFTNAASWYRDTRRTFNPSPSPSPSESPMISEQTPVDVVQ
jgi:peptide/nickel transport system substrate-binding protein